MAQGVLQDVGQGCCSKRTGSPSASTGPADPIAIWIRPVARPRRRTARPITSRTLKGVRSRTRAPASRRVMLSRLATNASSRSASSSIVAARSSRVARSKLSPNWRRLEAEARIAASGVREVVRDRGQQGVAQILGPRPRLGFGLRGGQAGPPEGGRPGVGEQLQKSLFFVRLRVYRFAAPRRHAQRDPGGAQTPQGPGRGPPGRANLSGIGLQHRGGRQVRRRIGRRGIAVEIGAVAHPGAAAARLRQVLRQFRSDGGFVRAPKTRGSPGTARPSPSPGPPHAAPGRGRGPSGCPSAWPPP